MSSARRKKVRGQPVLPVAALLAGVTLLAFGRVWSLGFINLDDPAYVAENPRVLAGLGSAGIAWAFTTFSLTNWHPLTWISLMLDATIAGADPHVYHATNLLLHVANTVLLFAVLARMTGQLRRSAFVAALFAVHPLHVESVVWVAERKDVLSTLFWLVTLWAYAGYAARPSPARYAAIVVSFALGLLAKPMLVTLPLLLLLLDLWPLGRFEVESARSLFREKIPLFALAGASCLVTLLAQRGSMRSLEAVPFGERVSNALVSYVAYIGKMLWPRGLSVVYPLSGGPLLIGEAAAAAAVLAAASFVAIRLARSRPWLCVGWFWFVVTLLPVIGLVQVGNQAMADRYTYMPLVGLFIVVAWGGSGLVRALPAVQPMLAPAAAVVVLVLAACTWVQVGYWTSSIELFTHALEATRANYVAHDNLAMALYARGDVDRAVDHWREAVELAPGFADAHYNLTRALISQRKVDEAASLAAEEEARWPARERTLIDLGAVAMMRGRIEEADRLLSEAARLYPESADARVNLAVVREQLGRNP